MEITFDALAVGYVSKKTVSRHQQSFSLALSIRNERQSIVTCRRLCGLYTRSSNNDIIRHTRSHTIASASMKVTYCNPNDSDKPYKDIPCSWSTLWRSSSCSIRYLSVAYLIQLWQIWHQSEIPSLRCYSHPIILHPSQQTHHHDVGSVSVRQL